jgi:superfamily II DNA helicase RecQ
MRGNSSACRVTHYEEWMKCVRRYTRRLRRIAREKFGFEEFRPGQEAAIKAILAGYDTLAIMPTRMGKSFIYQVAGLLVSGPIIISPLIVLQRDQVASLEQLQVGKAALLNSTMREAEHIAVLQEVLRYEGDKMVVLFGDVGYKTLAIDIVVERELLTLVAQG